MHRGWVSSAEFSPDGQQVVTASAQDVTERLWDAVSGEEIGELKHRGWVSSAQFSPPDDRARQAEATSYHRSVNVADRSTWDTRGQQKSQNQE